jgi:protein gp37
MSATSTIEWTDASWNPIRARNKTTGKVGWHCEHVSEGCRNCYAESINRRLGTGVDYKPGELTNNVEVFLDEKMLLAPLHWKRPRKIFVGSMTDLFATFVTAEWLDRVFAVMALCPRHTFQLLTKRPERMREYINPSTCARIFGARIDNHPSGTSGRLYEFIDLLPWPLPNVWLGTSVEDQPTADERIPHLLNTPAAIRFLSCEPLLGPIDLRRIEAVKNTYDARGGLKRCGIRIDALTGTYLESRVQYPNDKIDQVICGGESGRNARWMHPDLPRSLRDQCAASGVPYFFKQWGEWHPDGQAWGDGMLGLVVIPGEEIQFHRSGKKLAGRLLDGRTHSEFPA